jgi:hypothetical protein
LNPKFAPPIGIKLSHENLISVLSFISNDIKLLADDSLNSVAHGLPNYMIFTGHGLYVTDHKIAPLKPS